MSDAINNIRQSEYSALRISYTDKDYINILDDLINSIQGITQKWNTTDVNDVGMVLVKLMAMLGDMLFYNLDMQTLEVYPSSVTERKNASTIFKLIGYKMRWYRSAVAQANVVNTYTNSATIPRFCTFTTSDESITYCTFKQYELVSNTQNNGFETLIDLVQGVPVTPNRVTNNPYPEAGKQWHSIYGYNYTVDDVIGNKIYLAYTAVDQDHLILVDDTGEEWELRNNIYDTTAVGRFFEFGVDVNDRPYIELVDYWNNFKVHKFKLFYIRSAGEAGQVYSNTLTRVTGNIWSRSGTGKTASVYNVSTFLHINEQYASTLGFNPETPDEARKNSAYYINTLDTLITLADFERATMREVGVANVRATDLTNDPGVKKTFYLGDLNQDNLIDEDDYSILADYINDPSAHPLTSYQMKLADGNQDGVVDSADLACLRAFLDSHPVQQIDGSYICNNLAESGGIGTITASTTELLDGFTVKLYILRTEDYDSMDPEFDDAYTTMIISDLQEYKVLPIDIQVELHAIGKYFWSLQGKFVTKQPLSRDDLQNIIVSINRTLRYNYSVEKMNFNELPNYREIITNILAVDNRILMVDLEPIKYEDEEGKTVPKEKITGKYTQTVPQLNNSDTSLNRHYTFKLENAPILPRFSCS